MSGSNIADDALDRLTQRLTVEEKVSVLTGASAWATAPLPSIGLRSMVLSDGPSGVRGATWDERDPSICLPSATALSSTWDVAMAARYGAVAAAEARRKGVDVILGPTVNLHRSPLAGRQFEAFSEDPLLTADLAAAYVRGAQQLGVAATVKHFVANDSETDRYTADIRVEERPLRELYLAAFERAVRDAGAWCVMSAYNSVNGATMTENELLTDPLAASWSFDGVVVSDWTAVRSLESARHRQDLAMPGPAGPWGPALVTAIHEGLVAESLVDEKVRRILRLAARVGALEGHEPRPIGSMEDGVAFAREAAADGMVLVRNDGLLPIDPSSSLRIAVIGEHALRPRIQGGGSATVVPNRVVSPLDGIRAAVGDRVVVDYEPGAVVQEGFLPLDPARMTNLATGGPGARITYLTAEGEVLYTDDRLAGFILDFAPRDIDRSRASMIFETTYTPATTGAERFGFASPGHGRLLVDGVPVLDARVAEPPDQVQAFFSPPHVATSVDVRAGTPLALRYVFTPGAIVDGVPGSISVTFGTEVPPRTDVEDRELRDRAVSLARAADIVMVVVGTTEQVECEGYDRTSLRLPGPQDELVAAVVAVNSNTVVVVNAGAAVEMPWREQAAAVLLSWFGGQEYGHALADVLTGEREPGGRLPTTWPVRLEDAPVIDVTPVDGVVRYDEGLHIGYRAWLRADLSPAFPFGHGLGYTTWRLGRARSARTDTGVAVTLAVTNSGSRPGKQVVQVYARRPESDVERPALWLVGFATIRAVAGETAEARVEIPLRAFAHWADGWQVESGTYELLLGVSVAELSQTLTVDLNGSQSRP